MKEEIKKPPKKGNHVVNISSGWKGVVIDTNSKQDSSLVKFTHNPKREPDWIANNDLKVESKIMKKSELREIIREEIKSIIKEAKEKYSVYDKKTFNIIRSGLTKDAAIKLASKNKNYEYGSAAWVEDNYREHNK